MLHTLYGQALKNDCEFFIEFFALDLMMQVSRHRFPLCPWSTAPPGMTSPRIHSVRVLSLLRYQDGVCVGHVAMDMEDGTIHRFQSHATILATGGYGRAW
jgi:succinate dehydrogenase (ubiquinone) flavoprotein subunit